MGAIKSLDWTTEEKNFYPEKKTAIGKSTEMNSNKLPATTASEMARPTWK
jgi:hypothetical protein